MDTKFMITNIFNDIPTPLPEELFTQLLENKNVRIERIVSDGQRTPAGKWYDQMQNEWVIVLQGEAVIEYETTETHNLGQGDFLFIPAHTAHRVAWTSHTQQTIWLAIHWL
jgi:cupin 2 domain-containing protein